MMAAKKKTSPKKVVPTAIKVVKQKPVLHKMRNIYVLGGVVVVLLAATWILLLVTYFGAN